MSNEEIIEKLEARIRELVAENHRLRLLITSYSQAEQQRYNYEQDYLPYAEDERD